MSINDFETPKPWELSLEKNTVVTTDGSPLAEAGVDTQVVSKSALDAGRRAVLFSAGDVLTDTNELPDPYSAGVQHSLNHENLHVTDGNGGYTRLELPTDDHNA